MDYREAEPGAAATGALPAAAPDRLKQTGYVGGAHGGTVSAVARPEGGLEVTVTLPAAATTPVLAGSASVPLPR